MNEQSANDATPIRPVALVTGATSGLGFETALLLAEAGNDVIITGRDRQKSERAKMDLIDRFGRDVFTAIPLDLNSRAGTETAVAELADLGRTIDTVILNAGMVSGKEPSSTDDGIELTYSSSLIGHHRLTMGLLARGVLGSSARIVIAGSEAARGDIPTFNPTDIGELATAHFGGDLTAAAISLIRNEGPTRFKSASAYATAKSMMVWWTAELARRLPSGMTVNTVSPGSAPDTGAARNGTFFMKRIMVPITSKAPARFGLGATVRDAARRYVEVAGYGPEVTGRFYASAPKKMTGPLHEVDLDHLTDRRNQVAGWEAVVAVGGVDYPQAADGSVPSADRSVAG